MTKEVREEVKEAVNAVEVESSTTPEEETSPTEVKVEPVVEPVVEDDNKYQSQIDNLNIALKQEREGRRKEKEDFQSEIEKSSETINKLKDVFSPTEEVKEAEPVSVTQEQLEEFWESKQKEVESKTQEQKREVQIKDEISNLEKEFDGSEGKLKYDDTEILKWQQDNNKLYLTPKEAFYEAKRKDIIDYEVKQRLAGKKPTQEVEQPATAPGEHTSDPKKPKTEEETRRAVLEAMNAGETEM